MIVAAPDTKTVELFENGNYTQVAQTGDPALWQTHAAKGLCGLKDAALTGLAECDAPEARFYEAVTYWIDGDDDRALRALESFENSSASCAEHARNLLAMVRKERIHVLAQFPWTRSAPVDLLTAGHKDGRFKIDNLTFHPQDMANTANADIHRYYDRAAPPDFYTCMMTEWHVLPPNLQELPCPTIGQSSDYDAHIQCVHPWFNIYDEMLATTQTEWVELARLSGRPVTTFPKVFGVSDDLPPVPTGERDIDIFFSGTTFDPFHPDKAHLMHQVLRIPDLTVRLINGFVPAAAYNMLMGRSKLSFAYVRRPSGLPTRGIEALAMGCGLAVQAGCLISLYAGEDEGVVTFDYEADTLAPALQRLLHDWPRFQAGAQRGAAIMRREFGMARVASQHLRYLTFRAAAPRAKRKVTTPPAERIYKRTMCHRGWLPGPPQVMASLRDSAIHRWQAKIQTAPTASVINDMARELVLSAAHERRFSPEGSSWREMIQTALKLYRAGLKRFDKSLVLAFNMIRTGLFLGDEATAAEALEQAVHVLQKAPSSWDVDAMDDVFPFDFLCGAFNYRSYFDEVVAHLAHGKSRTREMVRLILASLHHLVGLQMNNAELLVKAVQLDPTFPMYKLYGARALVEHGAPEIMAQGVEWLVELGEESLLFVEASELLEQVQAKGLAPDRDLTELHRVAAFARQRGFTYTDWRKEPMRPLTTETTAPLGPDTLARPPHRFMRMQALELDPTKLTKDHVTLLTAILWADDAAALKGTLNSLARQSVAPRMEVMIIDRSEAQSLASAAATNANAFLKSTRYASDPSEPLFAAVNRRLAEARGEYVTFIQNGSRREPDVCKDLIDVLEAAPDTALAYADLGHYHRDETGGHLKRLAVSRRPTFERRMLFGADYIGLEPIWRRALHEVYGPFDPDFGDAAPYEFWLRMARFEKFLHVETEKPQMGRIYPKETVPTDGTAGPDAERARQAHWPQAWGERPSASPVRPMPNALVSGAWEHEISAAFYLSQIGGAQHDELRGMLDLVHNTVEHGETAIAEAVLSYLRERFGFLQSIGLLHGDLLRWLDREDEARAQYADALDRGAFRAALESRLATGDKEEES